MARENPPSLEVLVGHSFVHGGFSMAIFDYQILPEGKFQMGLVVVVDYPLVN
jgi:hypothetical protein